MIATVVVVPRIAHPLGYANSIHVLSADNKRTEAHLLNEIHLVMYSYNLTHVLDWVIVQFCFLYGLCKSWFVPINLLRMRISFYIFSNISYLSAV